MQSSPYKTLEWYVAMKTLETPASRFLLSMDLKIYKL